MSYLCRLARKVLIVSCLLLVSCSGLKELDEASPSFKFYAGATHGGIIENTDLELIRPISPDAFSGATRVGIQAGAHFEYPLSRISLETGLDLFLNGQVFTYEDYFPSFSGTRELLTTQLRIPLVVNFRLFKGVMEDGMLQLKLGLSPGYVFFSVEDQGADRQEPSQTIHDSKSFSSIPCRLLHNQRLISGVNFRKNIRITTTNGSPRSNTPPGGYWVKGKMPNLWIESGEVYPPWKDRYPFFLWHAFTPKIRIGAIGRPMNLAIST